MMFRTTSMGDLQEWTRNRGRRWRAVWTAWRKAISYTAQYALNDVFSRVHLHGMPALPELPRNLDERYREFIEGLLKTSQKRWEQVWPLLGALVVARDSGLTRDQLHGIMDLFKELTPSETDDLLSACAQYLEYTQPAGPFHVYHESFRRFLHDSTDPRRFYPAEANYAVANFFLQVYGSDWLACEDEYALRYTMVHLLEAAADTTARPEHRLVHAKIEAKAAALRQDESYKVARIRKFSRGELAPAVESFISRKALGFVGRRRVLLRLNNWLDAPESRHFLIAGGPGTGKTALAARLWQISRGLVAIDELQFPQLSLGYLTYAHLIQAMDRTSLAPLNFVEGLSRMLVYRYKDYARLYVDRVLQRLVLPGDHPTGGAALRPGPDKIQCERGSPAGSPAGRG